MTVPKTRNRNNQSALEQRKESEQLYYVFCNCINLRHQTDLNKQFQLCIMYCISSTFLKYFRLRRILLNREL